MPTSHAPLDRSAFSLSRCPKIRSRRRLRYQAARCRGRSHHDLPLGPALCARARAAAIRVAVARWLFSTTAELTIRGGGKPYSNMALDADRKNGPAARSFAADAHDCIMVRIKRTYRIQVCGTKMRPNGELPSDSQK